METDDAEKGIMKRTALFLAIAGILTLLLILLVARHAIAFGVPQVWVWQYKPLGAPARSLFSLVGLAALLGALIGAARHLFVAVPTRRGEFRALAALWAANVVMALSLALMHPWGWMYLATLIINPASNSYYSTALQHGDLTTLLHNYDRTMLGLISHAQTQSAGPVVFSELLRRFFVTLPFTRDLADTLLALSPGVNTEFIARQSAAWWQVPLDTVNVSAALLIALVFIGVGSFAVVPIYFAGKWLHGAWAGVLAAIGFMVLPGFHSFVAAVDQLYPFVTATALCLVLLARRAQRREWLWMGVAGLWLAVAVFMNMGLITLVPLCALFALFSPRREPSSPEASAASMASPAQAPPKRPSMPLGLLVFIAGLSVPWLFLYLVFHYNLFAVFLTSNRLRDTLYYHARPWPQAIIGNLLDFFVFVGVPVTLLFAWRLAREVRAVVGRRSLSMMNSLAASPLLWSFLLVLIALDLSGRVRGEAARLWMFLMPCALLSAAPQAENVWRASRPGALMLVALQWLQVVSFQYFVRVWGY
jgi:methylthioxylose transferase